MRFRSKQEQIKKVKWIEWLFVVIGVLLAVRSGASVWRLWKAGDRVKVAEIELDQTRELNLKLKGQVAEARSDEFVEREARDKLGLGREGEVILILPEQNHPNPKSQISSTMIEPEDLRPNWKKWWDLYIRI